MHVENICAIPVSSCHRHVLVTLSVLLTADQRRALYFSSRLLKIDVIDVRN